MQTILGAGGAISTGLARELTNYTGKIRLVSRRPERVNMSDELFPADLINLENVYKAVEGSEVAYLTAGFEYNVKVWREKWPVVMNNVITACKRYNVKLVFFDNVYMYDKHHMHHMTEETPVNPSSEKGKVRAEIAHMLMSEVEKGNLTAQIARCADFYGPKNSILTEMVYKNFAIGKRAQWLADAGKIHTFTFADDAARATAILGNTPDAYNQVWHLPTDSTPLTGKDWIGIFAEEMQVKPSRFVMPVWMMGLIGKFVPIIKEFKEISYQYDRDYFFDSSKFLKRFNFVPVSPIEGVRAVIRETSV